MNLTELRALLSGVASGSLEVDTAIDQLVHGPLADGAGYVDLGFARVDTHRALRTGEPEVVYGAGKTPEQIVAALTALRERSGSAPAMATRLAEPAVKAVRAAFPDILVDDDARCAVVGDLPEPRGDVCVVSAGTTDGPVAAEAALVARACGAGTRRIDDVGVAGIHRLLDVRDSLEAADCVIVVAGMEGALPSAVGGLIGAPIVAVPTSVGYGASLGGLAALLAMLNSCAPGVTVCNIDNGFGAGVFAARTVHRIDRTR